MMVKHRKSDRHSEDRQGHTEEHANVDESSPVIQLFRTFQKQLDSKHDKHERIVKLSRDITIESKRIIFTLHRVKDLESSTELLSQTEARLVELEKTKFKQIATELVDTDPYQFLRAYTAGLQEYIEALTFHFYLKENKLIPLKQVQERLTFTVDENTTASDTRKSDHSDTGQATESGSDLGESNVENKGSSEQDTEKTIKVEVPASEYVLGIADLTGEMMRRAINSVGDGDLNRPFEICTFLQEIELAYSSLTNCNREVNRKLTVLRQSLRKVEAACYTLKVRGSEIPKHMLVDVISKTHSAAQFMDDLVTEDE